MAYARPGDIVSRRKWLVMHKGIALGGGRVLHNTPFKGEHICSESEFREGRRMYVSSADIASRHRAIRVAELQAQRGRRYNLLTNNCEHTVSRASSGDARSPQLQSWLLGTGFAAATFVVTRHPVATAAAYALGRKLSSRLGRGLGRTGFSK